jgi:predicted transcriptional regulator
MQELYKPSSKELESIEAGRKDIEEGKYKPHSDVMKDVAEWLENPKK